MILSMIYVDRFLHSTGLSITSLNVHKLLLTAIMLASKFNDDAYCSNSFFAEVGCVSLAELNQMEQTFLRCICFSLFVSESQFILYSSSLHQRVCTASCALCTLSSPLPLLDFNPLYSSSYSAASSPSTPTYSTGSAFSAAPERFAWGYSPSPYAASSAEPMLELYRGDAFDASEEAPWYSPVCSQTRHTLSRKMD